MGKLLDMFGFAGLEINDLRGKLPLNPLIPLDNRELIDVDLAILHHTAGWPTALAKNLAQFHIEERDFPAIAYTFYLKHPSVYQPKKVVIDFCNRLRDISWHAKGSNLTSFGIAVGGYYVDSEPPRLLMETVATLIQTLERFFAEEVGKTLIVKPHFAVSKTLCPGKVWEAYKKIKT